MACIHCDWLPALNPYRSEQIVVLIALVVGFLAWHRVRPKTSWLVAGYMTAGSLVTMYATCMHSSARSTASCESAAMIILEASTALTVCIYVEVIRTLRQRRRPELALAQALASHVRRNRSE